MPDYRELCPLNGIFTVALRHLIALISHLSQHSISYESSWQSFLRTKAIRRLQRRLIGGFKLRVDMYMGHDEEGIRMSCSIFKTLV